MVLDIVLNFLEFVILSKYYDLYVDKINWNGLCDVID